MTVDHGTITPANGPAGSTRGNHILQGWADVVDEAARAALTVLATDLGRAVRQTAGTKLGYYISIATGTGLDKWQFIGDADSFNLIATVVGPTTATLDAEDWAPIDLSSGSVTINLPASPLADDEVAIKILDSAAANTLTVSGNGNDVENPEDHTFGSSWAVINVTAGAYIEYIYDAANTRWVAGATASGADVILSLRQQESAGILSGGNIVAGTLSDEFTVNAGTGRIVNFSNPLSPINQLVTFGPFTDITPTLIATTQVTVLAVDSAGLLVQQTAAFTDSQRRSLIILGAVTHFDNATITDRLAVPDIAYSGQMDFKDFIRTLSPFVRSGGVISGNAALTYDTSAGTAFEDGGNFHADANLPSVVSFIATAPTTFDRVFTDGVQGGDTEQETAGTTLIDPLQFESAGGGTLSAVSAAAGGTRATIQRVYFSSIGQFVGYGQTEYASLSDAVSGIDTEMALLVESALMQAFVLIGWWCVTQGATDLSDDTQAQYVTNRAGGAGSGGGGGGGGGGGTAFSLISDTISANQNNYSPTSWATATHLRLTATGDNRNITGLASVSGTDSFIKNIINIADFAVTLTHDDAASTAANRILLPGDLDFSIGPNESASVFYDATSSRWRLQ